MSARQTVLAYPANLRDLHSDEGRFEIYWNDRENSLELDFMIPFPYPGRLRGFTNISDEEGLLQVIISVVCMTNDIDFATVCGKN